MSRWFAIRKDMLNAYQLQKLPPEEFVAKFMAAIDGEKNEFSPYIRVGLNRPTVPQWAKIRAAIFKRDDYTCRYCGSRGGKLECDHIMPLSRGGSNEEDNLATACKPCNRSKRSKTLEEWRGPHSHH